MKIRYELDTDNYYVDSFEYEPDDKKLQDFIIKLLLRDVKDINGSMYSEDGAYQMAVYMVGELECYEHLAKNVYYDEIKEHFESDAYEEYYREND